MISFASEALRTTAISSGSQPNAFGQVDPRRFHARLEDLPVVDRRDLVREPDVAHELLDHELGAGEMPPLLRLISVRSTSNARWIGPQKSSSSARSSGVWYDATGWPP